MEKRPGTEHLQRVLLEEVIKSYLLADDKTIPAMRDSQDCEGMLVVIVDRKLLVPKVMTWFWNIL